ncbi:dTDP-4-dehydrorhamnose reductase [Thermodesulfobacteriota bacterium]
MKIAVIGANGQLGSDIYKAFQKNGDEVIALNHDLLEVSDLGSVESVLKNIMPDILVNTAAMHNVEVCETDPAKAFAVNGIGAWNLAKVSNEVGYTLMHISTDYVFDGSKMMPYTENDLPKPLNAYGNTKLSGEYFVQSIAKKHFILRVSGIYGKNPCRAKGGLNFVTLMLKLAKERDEVRVVDDEFLAPTYTFHIANQLVKLSESNEYGLYHVAAQESCSWYQFAAKIFELTDANVKLNIAAPDEFPIKVPRPKYSVLENKGLKDIGLDIMPHWQSGLKEFLDTLTCL